MGDPTCPNCGRRGLYVLPSMLASRLRWQCRRCLTVFTTRRNER